MPKRKTVTPDSIRPYEFHGVELDWETETNPSGECPFCSKHKFAVNVDTGLARCFVCGISSDSGVGLNPQSFVQELYAMLLSQDRDDSYYEDLSDNRFIRIETLRRFGLVKHHGRWLIPAYNAEGNLRQLYKYSSTCYPTPTLGAQIFGANFVDKSHSVLNICEGVWDTMAMYEAFQDEGLEESVIGLPGISVFNREWLKLVKKFSQVNIWQDNDHPKVVDGMQRGLAGEKGVKFLASILRGSGGLSGDAKLMYCSWGNSEEAGFNLEIENKCDVRDILTGKVEI